MNPSRALLLPAALASLAALHALVAFPYPWEEVRGAGAWLAPSPDLALVLAAAVVLSLRLGPRRWIAWSAGLLLLLVPLLRLGATVVRSFHGRELDLWQDVLLLPGLVHLAVHRLAPAGQWAAGAAMLLGLAAAGWAAARLAAVLLAAARQPAVAAVVLACCQLVAVAGWTERSAGGGTRLLREGMLARAGGEGFRLAAAGGHRARETVAAREAAALEELARTPADLAALEGADVFLLFLESYGAALLGRGEEAGLRPLLRELEGHLEAAGIAACSALAAPSIRGGASFLAHAELHCGIPVEGRRVFDLLAETRLVPLPRHFARAGWHTVNVQPAVAGDWPEGAFFGFREQVLQRDLPYRGTHYHWGLMPDQFALAHVLREVVEPARTPLFVQYVSVTSHAPWSAVPPLLEDWAAAAEPGAFAGPPARVRPLEWTNLHGHPLAEEALMDCMDYSLRTAVGFVERLPRRFLALVLGDHQPPAVGPLTSADTGREVPVHALSRDPALLRPLRERGFTRGLLPGQGPAVPFHRLHFLLLHAWGGAQPGEGEER